MTAKSPITASVSSAMNCVRNMDYPLFPPVNSVGKNTRNGRLAKTVLHGKNA